jgi:hypothetical protein
MEMNDAQLRLEDCRVEVLNALYARRMGAHEAATIRTVFIRNPYTEAEIQTAIADLIRLSLVEEIFTGVARTIPAYQITAEGLRHKERPRR